MGSFFQLRHLVASELGSDRLALEADRGLPHNITTEMDLALWDVAQQIRTKADPRNTRAHFAAADPSDLAAEYLAGKLPPVVQTTLAGFLVRYGFRGLAEIDLGRPRWRENPAQIMQIVRNYTRITDPARRPTRCSAEARRPPKPPSRRSPPRYIIRSRDGWRDSSRAGCARWRGCGSSQSSC